MKQSLSKALLAFALAFAAPFQSAFSANVTINGGETWTGFMSVFQNAGGSKGVAAFESAWAISDVKSTISGSTVTLQPNFNTYANSLGGAAADRAFWTSSTDGGVTAGLLGNKWMEGSTFVQNGTYAGGSLTFEGLVNSFTLNRNYRATAFIKSFDASWGWIGMSTVDLTSTGAFSVTFNAGAGIVQYGFGVHGLNANPNDEASLGSVVVTGIPEPTTPALIGLGAAGLLLVRRIRRNA